MHYTQFGYDTYQEYVDGPEWEQLRDFYYKNCGPYKCRVCKVTRGLLLHKRSYEFLTLWSLRKRYILNIFIAWKMKKIMTWLCFEHNDEIHFYDTGGRVPLVFAELKRREDEVFKRYNSWWYKFLRARPSDLLAWLMP